MLVHWIWLATRPGMHDRDKRVVLEHFSDPEDVFYAQKAAFHGLEGVTEACVEALVDKDLSQAEKILRDCADKGIRICTYTDAAYPSRLKHIPDPPLVLYYKGMLPNLDGIPVVGVVGTRRPSAYGLSVARRMGYQIARCGAVVVSGVATGIDSAAMTGAMTGDGCVVGVLGCGADVVYPASNRSIYLDTERRGCLLSEFPPGTPPYKWNFPKRNRIISGLSNGVLVVEAPEGSGSLITARRAADQGRDVFVVPGNVDMPGFAGSNALLRAGAIMAANGWDVVGEYEALYPGKLHRDGLRQQEDLDFSEHNDSQSLAKVAQKPSEFPKKKLFDKKKEKITIDKEEPCAYSDQSDSYVPGSEEEKLLLDSLGFEERLVDELIAETKLPTGKVLGMLTLLEIKGVVARLPGKRVKRKHKP